MSGTTMTVLMLDSWSLGASIGAMAPWPGMVSNELSWRIAWSLAPEWLQSLQKHIKTRRDWDYDPLAKCEFAGIIPSIMTWSCLKIGYTSSDQIHFV